MVRLGRELRGMTQTALAAAARLAQARLSRIESGQVDPSDAELEQLALALELPVRFLTEPGAPAAVPMFRKRAIRSARKVAAIQARLNTAVLVAQRLLEAGIEI